MVSVIQPPTLREHKARKRVANMALVKGQRPVAPTRQCHLFSEQQTRDVSPSLGGFEKERSSFLLGLNLPEDRNRCICRSLSDTGQSVNRHLADPLVLSGGPYKSE